MTTTTTTTRTRSATAAAVSLNTRALRPRRRRRKQSKSNRTPNPAISRASKAPKHSIDPDRPAANADVSDDVTQPCSTSTNELGLDLDLARKFGSSRDMVWAKAYSNIWLPGHVSSEYDGKVLVSFFGCKRSVWASRSETRCFEGDFEEMVGKEALKRSDSGAIGGALEEFGRRLTLELSCSCQDMAEDGEELEGRGKVDLYEAEAFRPREALRVIREIACARDTVGEVESIGVFRAGAQLNAFRRFAFIKRDWIYEKTMRLSEADGGSQDEITSICSEDEIACLVDRDMEFPNEELEDGVVDSDGDNNEEELGGEEENDDCMEQDNSFIGIEDAHFEDFNNERTSVMSDDVEFDDEELEDGAVDDIDDTDEEELGGDFDEDEDIQCVKQDKNFIGIRNTCLEDFEDERTSIMSNDVELDDAGEREYDVDEENRAGESIEKVKSIEQECVIEKSQIMVQGVFSPVEVLAFVQRMALFTWVDDAENLSVIRVAACVKKFRRHTFIRHDWIYHETMRLSDSTDESDGCMNGTSSIHKKIKKVSISDDGEDIHGQFVRSMQSGSTMCKKTTEDPPHDILRHLYCLAIDPFSGSKWHGVKNYNFVCKKILRYRELLYEKVTDFSQSIECTSCDDGVAETSEVQNFLKSTPTTSLTRSEGKDCDRRLNLKDVVEPVHRDLRVTRGSINCNGEFKSDMIQKIKVSSSSCNVEGREIVDHQRDIRICNQKTEDIIISKMNNRGQIVDGNTCSTSITRGRGTVNFRRDTPALDGECKINKRSETETGKVFTSNKRQKTVDADVKRDIINVEGGNLIDAERQIPECNVEYKSNKRQKTEDINLCRTSKVKNKNASNSGKVNERQKTEEVMVHKRICNGHFESNKCQKISASDSVLNLQGQSTNTLPGGISASAIIGSDESKTPSHVLKDHLKSKHWNEACTGGRNVDLKVDCKSAGMLSTLTGETKSQDSGGALSEVRTGFAASQCPSSSPLSYSNIDLHPSSGSDTDIINKELSARVFSGGCPELNKSQRPVDKSVKFQQPKTLLPLTMLYSSPLSAASPARSGFQCQSSKLPIHSDNPTTLHMKFPRDFKLPSKEELMNKFRPFGPIDHLKTKIFFYTGSAQIVFLHYLDAESACHYAKRKQIFLGEANVRVWIDQHEHSRRGTNNSSAPVSLLTAGSSVPNVKPCLKVSKGINSERKHLHVKFPSSNQDPPSDTVETCTDVLDCGKEVGPNISLQMSALLEKCDKTVNEIKNTLGLQSFYSLFKQIS